MKEAADYQRKDGSYDDDQVIIDAFGGDMAQFEEFLGRKLNWKISGILSGTPEPTLPEPYEALYQQIYALQIKWNEAHAPQLRRDIRKEYGYYPIVAIGGEE
jgi:hypothetical protein